MASKKTFLSRLQNLRQTGKGARSPKNKQAAQEIPANHDILNLPPEHPLNLLYRRYKNESNSAPLALHLPVPSQHLPGSSGEPSEETVPLLSNEEVAREILILEKRLSAAAAKRIQAIEAEETPDLDAEILVFLPISRLAAWFFIYPPVGQGLELNREMLETALEKNNICYGVDQKLLDDLPGREDRYFQLHMAACGEAPLHGKDGYVIDLFSRNSIRTLMEDKDFRIDQDLEDLFQSAKKGDVICRIFPPTPCRDGRTVQNNIYYAKAGQPAVVPGGRNTRLSEDGSCLLATCEGNVEFNGQHFLVKPVLDLKGDVDSTSGDINCLGDIHIHGDVRSGFAVRATGNITVDGVIEAGIIEAGNDLIVRKGVQGNGQAILRAHRSIYAKYLEGCSVHVRESLEAECIINCNIFSDGDVLIRTGRGAIMGGHIRAARLIHANIVGARSEISTCIILGGKPCEAFEREILVKQISDQERELKKLLQQPDRSNWQKQINKTRTQLQTNKMKLHQFDEEIEKLNSKDQKPSGKLICQRAYPGTEIAIGKASLRLNRETDGCTAFWEKGEIVLSQG